MNIYNAVPGCQIFDGTSRLYRNFVESDDLVNWMCDVMKVLANDVETD